MSNEAPDFTDESTLWNGRPPLNITSIRNRIIEDPELSYRAKGVAIYLLSKPPGWKVQVTDIRRHGKEGRDAIYGALRELREHGYAKFQGEIPGSQRAGWSISDLPQFEKLESNPNDDSPRPEKPNVATGTIPETPSGTPRPEKPDTGNQEPLVKPKNIKESKDSFDEGQGKLLQSEQKPKAAPPPREKKHKMTPLRRNPWTVFLEGAVIAWNGNRRMSWPEIKTLTGRELKDLSEFYHHYEKDVDTALAKLSSAIAWANRRESWTEGKVLTLAELLAKSKLIQYAQKASHVNSEAREGASKDNGGQVVRVGATHSFQGAVNVKVIAVSGGTAEVENLETGVQHTAYFDDLGAEI